MAASFQPHRLRHGPSHPLCLAAVAVLVVNDHVLKHAWPSWWTGKLSDPTWLIVASVVTASVLVRLGVSGRLAAWVAPATTGCAFVALQVWSPLGDAWVAMFGGSHTPDLTDLLALPALALVPWCWRPVNPRGWALPIAGLACVATVGDYHAWCGSRRRPLDGQRIDPHRALRLGFGDDSVWSDLPDLRSHILLRDDAGNDVPYLLGAYGNSLAICPVGGLEPEARYTWTVRPFPEHATNHLTPPPFTRTGTWSFTTASTANRQRVTTAAQCRARARANPRCGDLLDRAKTADTAATVYGWLE